MIQSARSLEILYLLKLKNLIKNYMNNLEDLRLKTQTPPPRDKVKLWHEQMLGINNRIVSLCFEYHCFTFLIKAKNAPLPPVPPQSNTISESPSQSVS